MSGKGIFCRQLSLLEQIRMMERKGGREERWRGRVRDKGSSGRKAGSKQANKVKIPVCSCLQLISSGG